MNDLEYLEHIRGYDLSQLEDALNWLDRKRHPHRYVLLCQEIARRRTEADAENPPEPPPGRAIPTRTFAELVHRLLSAPPGKLGPTLLIQQHGSDAILLLQSEHLIVLLMSDPWEDIAYTLPDRLHAAFASERELVREAAGQGLVWVVIVDASRPLDTLGLKAGKRVGSLGIRPQFLRIQDGYFRFEALTHGVDNATVRKCQTTLRSAVRSHGGRLDLGAVEARERAGEQALASEADARRRMRSAYPALLGVALVCVALFVGTQIFGGFDQPFVLVPMGALHPALVWVGEWWRLLTCAYLHADGVHLISNLGAGFVFAPLVAAALGPWRTLALFQVSALGGSALALLTSRSTVVGASAGLFGLLAALVVLARREPGLVPLRERRKLWLFGLIYLGLNAVSSLTPGISLAGHTGGFMTGLVLSLSGALFAGLPKLDASPGAADPHRGRVAALVVAMSLGSVAGFALSWVRHAPWHHRWPLAPVTRHLEGVPIAIDVPASFSPLGRIRDGYYAAAVPGDPVRLDLTVSPERLPVEDALEDARKTLDVLWPEEGFAWARRPEIAALGSRRVLRASIVRVESRATGRGGTISRRFELERIVLIEDGWRIAVTVFPAPNLPPEWPGRIESILSSVRVVQ